MEFLKGDMFKEWMMKKKVQEGLHFEHYRKINK